jgi:hypothetical protein
MRFKTDRTSLTPRRFNPRFNKAIAAYASAASAVGVAILAAAQPAEGKIVYTKTREIFTGVTRSTSTTMALPISASAIVPVEGRPPPHGRSPAQQETRCASGLHSPVTLELCRVALPSVRSRRSYL